MKKFITLLTAVIVSAVCTVKAQVIPNENMENWTSIGNYEAPVGWTTPNSFVHLVFKESTDVNSGNFAAKMVAGSFFGITVPGAIGTGALNIFTQTFTGGFPLTDPNVVAMIGYYKYTGVGGDSALMYSILTHWDNVLQKRDTVGIAQFVGGDVSGYTLLPRLIFLKMRILLTVRLSYFRHS